MGSLGGGRRGTAWGHDAHPCVPPHPCTKGWGLCLGLWGVGVPKARIAKGGWKVSGTTGSSLSWSPLSNWSWQEGLTSRRALVRHVEHPTLCWSWDHFPPGDALRAVSPSWDERTEQNVSWQLALSPCSINSFAACPQQLCSIPSPSGKSLLPMQVFRRAEAPLNPTGAE